MTIALRNGITEKDNFDLLNEYSKLLDNVTIMENDFTMLKRH
jgi:hypothetical protein